MKKLLLLSLFIPLASLTAGNAENRPCVSCVQEDVRAAIKYEIRMHMDSVKLAKLAELHNIRAAYDSMFAELANMKKKNERIVVMHIDTFPRPFAGPWIVTWYGTETAQGVQFHHRRDKYVR